MSCNIPPLRMLHQNSRVLAMQSTRGNLSWNWPGTYSSTLNSRDLYSWALPDSILCYSLSSARLSNSSYLSDITMGLSLYSPLNYYFLSPDMSFRNPIKLPLKVFFHLVFHWLQRDKLIRIDHLRTSYSLSYYNVFAYTSCPISPNIIHHAYSALYFLHSFLSLYYIHSVLSVCLRLSE